MKTTQSLPCTRCDGFAIECDGAPCKACSGTGLRSCCDCPGVPAIAVLNNHGVCVDCLAYNTLGSHLAEMVRRVACFVVLGLSMIACGDVPFAVEENIHPATQMCEQDAELVAFKAKPKYTGGACPTETQFKGTGCTRCVYVDSCGGAWQVQGCEPAPGVWCSDGVSCPMGFETRTDSTVKEMAQ